MNRACFLLLFVVSTHWAQGQKAFAPSQLRTDLLLHTGQVRKNGLPANEALATAVKHPTEYQFAVITSARPAFSWALDERIQRSSAYRVLVASSPELLDKNTPDYWDSGRQSSPATRALYAGKPLKNGQVYYWKVMVWNEKNAPQLFSQPAAFYHDTLNTTELFAHYPLAADVQQPVAVRQTGPGAYFLDFGKDGFAQLTLHLTAEAPDSIQLEVGEALAGPTVINANAGRNIRYMKLPLLLKKGTHDYTITWPTDEKRNSRNPILMPDYIGEVYPFRYLTIRHYNGPLTPQSVQRKRVHYPFNESAASFTSSDTVLNQVWDLCKYSIEATSFCGYYVDGDRERVPYEADALINQLSHYAVDAEYSMARRSLTYLLFHPTWPTEWSLQNVLIAWNDYQYTGDTLLLKTYYPELQRKILMPLAGETGLISTLTDKQTTEFLATIHITKPFDGKRGLKDNVDWPQKGDYIGPEKEYGGETDGFVYTTYNSVINAYYYRNLVLMQQIALLLNKPADAALYAQKASAVATAFRTTFRDPATGLIRDGESTTHTSLHANMFALAFGLIPDADIAAVTRYIKSRRMACSVYGAQFLLEALYDAGMGDYALELMTATTQRSWYNMIRVGSTISMEAWDKVYKPNLDLNHAWGAAPANIIARKLMGVEPLTPGFATFQVKPQPGHLTYASLKTPTIRGEVAVMYQQQADTNSLTVSVPGGTLATLYMPASPGKIHLFLDGKPIRNEPQKGFLLIKDVPSGTHVITLR